MSLLDLRLSRLRTNRVRRGAHHAMECTCKACRPTAPSDRHSIVTGSTPTLAQASFALGVTAVVTGLAATGNLGAALHALVGQ